MQETRVRSLGWEDPLEKEMTTHSSTLAWRIPWREEPGRLQSMGSQRVGHNWATSLFCKTHKTQTARPWNNRSLSLSSFMSLNRILETLSIHLSYRLLYLTSRSIPTFYYYCKLYLFIFIVYLNFCFPVYRYSGFSLNPKIWVIILLFFLPMDFPV